MSDFPKPDLAKRDKAIVELALPGHLLVLMNEWAGEKGVDMRPDAVEKLNMAAAAPLVDLDPFTVRRLAQKIDDVATTLLRDLNVDDPRDGLYIVATFNTLLVSEGLYADPTSNAITVALLLRDDIRDDKPDVNGQGVVWRLDEARWAKKSKDLLRRANLMGFYEGVVAKTPSSERELSVG